MKKLSISVSDQTHSRLQELAAEHKSNPSVVLESSLRSFSALDSTERDRVIRETRVFKKALTRSGWRSLFWASLAEQFGVVDFARGLAEYLMAPRRHLGFEVVFLIADMKNPDSGDFIVDVYEAPPWDVHTKHISNRWSFPEGHLVNEAAAEVATWIRKNAHLLGSVHQSPIERSGRLREMAKTLISLPTRIVYFDNTIIRGILREVGDSYAVVAEDGRGWKQPILLDFDQIFLVEPASR